VIKGLVVLWLAAMSLTLVAASDSSALVGKVNVAATLLDVRISDVGTPGRSSGDGTAEVLRLWNRTVSDLPVGNGLIRCTFLGKGGAFGRGMSYCVGTFTLGSGHKFGKITVTGPRYRTRYGNYVVTGSTGVYSGSSGSMHVRPGEMPGTLSITFQLIG